jgi:hypothetical protein
MSGKLTIKNNDNTEFTIEHKDGSNAKSIVSKDISIAVDTINDFPSSPNDGDVVVVRDLDRGGTFIYDSSKVTEHNDGTNFNGWIRQFSGPVNVKWFGAKGDGITDDTEAFSNAISFASLKRVKTIIPPSLYIINELTMSSNTVLEGLGFKRDDSSDNGGVVLKTTSGDFCIQTLDITDGAGVSGYAISNIKIKCNSSTHYGIKLFGTDAKVSNIVVDGAVNGVGVFIGWAWRASYTNIRITNCSIGLQLNDSVNKSSPVNGCVFNALTIESSTIGVYAVKNVGSSQSVANTFNGLILEGLGLSQDRNFPTFLSLNPFVESELGMTTSTITGGFFCEQEFQAVINGWYSENVPGVHLFTGYYCEIEMHSPYFEIEKYQEDLVRDYPMICSNQSPILIYNGRFYHKNLNSNAPFISVKPTNTNIFEGCKSSGTNIARNLFTYILDNSQDHKFYDGSYNVGTYQTSSGIPIKRGAVYANNLKTVSRIAYYLNKANNSHINVSNLHGVYFEFNDDVNRHLYLDGCTDENKTIKISIANTHSTESVVIWLHSDLDGGASDTLGGILDVTIPSLVVRTLEIINLGGTWRIISGGDLSIPS